MFQTIITIMIANNNNPYIGDFSKNLFETPAPIIDPNNENKLIYHPFHNFKLNKYRQQAAFEGCDQWFDVIDKMLLKVFKLFKVATISQILCSNCRFEHKPKIIYQHALSISIDKNNINSIQNAINLFQKSETI